ncbi:MAG: hypothetical protein QXP81_07880 [Nitrososphaerota archaeon]
MSTYVYDEVVMPDEGLKEVQLKGRAARINYLKSYGPEAPPGWVIGTGRLEGSRFHLEEEFVARHLIIRTKAFGMVGIQRRGDEVYDRGWILVPYRRIEFDGEVCVIE